MMGGEMQLTGENLHLEGNCRFFIFFYFLNYNNKKFETRLPPFLPFYLKCTHTAALWQQWGAASTATDATDAATK